MDNIKSLEPFFGSWRLGELIGEGSFGKVYKIKRETFGKEQYSALKVIGIPQNDAELKQAYNEGMDDISVTSYFDSIVKNIASEIDMMVRFKGNTNIVSYEDHQIIPNENGIGATILIRMELLKSLNDLMNNASLKTKDVLRLGMDICKALEKCHANKVIHRDIKLEKIFVNADGDYKLGDFGIARQLEKTMSGLSKKGTYSYMAPEVYLGKAYNATVDIYSLGIVMYRLLNNNRTPFLPAYPAPISFNEKNDAQNKRMAGETIPPPTNADSSLAQIVLKACAFRAGERYETPTQMREALEAILYSEGETELICPADETLHNSAGKSTGNSSENSDKTASIFDSNTDVENIDEKTQSILQGDAADINQDSPDTTGTDPVIQSFEKIAQPEIPPGLFHPNDKTGNGRKKTKKPVWIAVALICLLFVFCGISWGFAVLKKVPADSETTIAAKATTVSQNTEGLTELETEKATTVPKTTMQNAEDFIIENGKFKEYKGLDGDVVIPNSVKVIADDVFYMRGVTNVIIPEGVTSIMSAFSRCYALKSVAIPSTVTNIEWNFSECGSLNEINVSSANPVYSSIDGILFDKTKEKLIRYPGGKRGEYTIPSSVTRLEEDAFSFCERLTGIIIPGNVEFIPNGAFWECHNLENIVIKDGVSSIGASAFTACGLSQITIPNSIISIGENAFLGCWNLKEVFIPESVREIGEHAFGYTYKALQEKIEIVISCPKGSTAEKYCMDNDIDYKIRPFSTE